MRLKRHVPLLESTLKHAIGRPLTSSLRNRCRYATSSAAAAYPEEVAVLGGGVSGLASAYFIAKEFPNSKITVFEAGTELGGWIKSRRVDVPGGTVLFEHGPRTLRPGAASMATAQLVQELNLEGDILYTSRTAPGAANRFIYYPDRLNCLPSPASPITLSSLFELWRSGILDGAFRAFFDWWTPGRPSSLTDESVGSFLSRRFDRRLANNIASAVMHGIYAGDIWQLSARTLLRQAWELEGIHGSVLRGLARTNGENPQELSALFHPYDLDALNSMRDEIKLNDKLVEDLSACSIFTFRNGLQDLVKALHKSLQANPQVQIRLGTSVQQDEMFKSGDERPHLVTRTEASAPRTEQFDLVISTLRNVPLTDYVTVMTVNLYFPKPGLLPVQGFGYLIPQSVPFGQNPERALGVIFDSDAIVGQDTTSGTKLTVMLGGHWWNGWDNFPDHEEGLELAKSVIRRHLHINEEPVECHVNLARDCIPQYTVGYDERLREYANTLHRTNRGRIRVVGNQYHGVGVNDCIRAAWLVARSLRGNGWKERGTGLERALDERPWVRAPLKQSYRKVDTAHV